MGYEMPVLFYRCVSDAVGEVIRVKENRHFVPHVTIARVRRANRRSLESRIKEHAEIEFGSFNVGGFSLKKSTLTQDGPIYDTLREFPLEG